MTPTRAKSSSARAAPSAVAPPNSTSASTASTDRAKVRSYSGGPTGTRTRDLRIKKPAEPAEITQSRENTTTASDPVTTRPEPRGNPVALADAQDVVETA